MINLRSTRGNNIQKYWCIVTVYLSTIDIRPSLNYADVSGNGHT